MSVRFVCQFFSVCRFICLFLYVCQFFSVYFCMSVNFCLLIFSVRRFLCLLDFVLSVVLFLTFFVSMLPPTQIKYPLPRPGRCHNIVQSTTTQKKLLLKTFFSSFLSSFPASCLAGKKQECARCCKRCQTQKILNFFFFEIMKQLKCRKRDLHFL